MKRSHLNSLALLTLENRQLGQEGGEWDICPFPLKQPLSNWRAVPLGGVGMWQTRFVAVCPCCSWKLNHRNR